jgi:hypothetical protein
MQAHVCGKYSPRKHLFYLENFKFSGDYLYKILQTLFKENENNKQDKYLSDLYKNGNEYFMWQVWWKGEMCTRCCWGNQRERDHWGDQDVGGRIILR